MEPEPEPIATVHVEGGEKEGLQRRAIDLGTYDIAVLTNLVGSVEQKKGTRISDIVLDIGMAIWNHHTYGS